MMASDSSMCSESSTISYESFARNTSNEEHLSTTEEEDDGQLSFWYTNATSLNNKLNSLIATLQVTKSQVVLVSETWFDDSSVVNMPNYKPFRVDRKSGRGGGVCIYVRDSLDATEVVWPELLDKGCEQAWCSIGSSNRALLVGCIYRPPPKKKDCQMELADASNELECMSRAIEKAGEIVRTGKQAGVILAGDFNMRDVDWNELGVGVVREEADQSERLVSTFAASSLTQIVDKHTFYWTNSYSSLLDLVLVSHPNNVSEVKVGPPLDRNLVKSHYSLEFKAFVDKNRESQQSFNSEAFAYQTGNYVKFSEFIRSQNWQQLMGGNDVESAYRALVDVYQTGCNKYIKLKRKRWKEKPRWWSADLSKLVRLKRSLFFRNCAAGWCIDEMRVKYKAIDKQVKRAVQRAVASFEEQLVVAAKACPKLLYNYINRRFSSKESIAAMMDSDGNVTTERRAICNTLNEYFHSVFSPPTATERVRRAIDEMDASRVVPQILDVASMVSPDRIEKKLANLELYKSPGVDKISTYVLKRCAHEWARPLSKLFSMSLTNGKLPDAWKLANVTPLHKKGSRTQPNNYRPVSLTSCVCKILESLIKDEIMKHLVASELLTTAQHGFVPRKACVTNLLETIDYLTNSMNEKIPSDVIFLDYEKAFDRVSHGLLLVKLRACGIAELLVRWIDSFLHGRKQRVVMGEEVSEWRSVTSGVPQGSEYKCHISRQARVHVFTLTSLCMLYCSPSSNLYITMFSKGKSLNKQKSSSR